MAVPVAAAPAPPPPTLALRRRQPSLLPRRRITRLNSLLSNLQSCQVHQNTRMGLARAGSTQRGVTLVELCLCTIQRNLLKCSMY